MHNGTQYNAIELRYGQLSLIYDRLSLTCLWGGYGVSFVSSNFDQCPTSTIIIFYETVCHILNHANQTRRCPQVNAKEPHWWEVKIFQVTVRQKAITWGNIDLDLCHHMAPPGHSELIRVVRFHCTIFESLSVVELEQGRAVSCVASPFLWGTLATWLLT